MSRIGFASVAGLLLSALPLAEPVTARQWSPDAHGAALDYTQIIHAKPNGEGVVVWWVVPEVFVDAPNSQVLQNVSSRYVVVGVADAHPGPNGAMAFDNTTGLTIEDQTSKLVSALPENATPPDVAEAIATLQALARQSLGPFGQGMRWFVFDDNAVHSCTPGKMSVPFRGETYTYDTPIPGCPKP